ncbi:TraB/GumN family protein [Hirschia litorea]|uniref:TraB/GumN family protein n=1 Tax=Hirschia litorea TaxID=1199156 RepID=A0ABW2IIB7_9PROT
MLKQFLSVSATVIACLTLPACSQKIEKEEVSVSEPVVLKAAALENGEGPALWKTGDADTTVYLFGTVHVLPPSLQWRTEAFETAFSRSDVVYFEADVSGEDASLARAVAKLGFMPVGKDLFSLLNANDADALKVAAAELNFPTAAVAKMQPWFAAMMIVMQAIVAEGQDPESGVENILVPEAKIANKELRYFETAEQQLSFMANLDEDVQVNLLMETVRQIESIGSSIIEMDNAWVVGDIATLEKIVLSDPSMASEELMDVMLVKRNANWTVEINKLIEKEEGVFFIAVGAAHLVGKDSVVSMLKDAGISVTRVQ